MRVAVTGAHGLIGSRLCSVLRERGDTVAEVGRMSSSASSGSSSFSSSSASVPTWDASALAGADAVVNLAGPGLAGRRWTSAYQATLKDSRVEGTRRLVELLRGSATAGGSGSAEGSSAAAGRGSVPGANRPRVLVSGSAVGYYGSRGDELLEETSSGGTDFLGRLCRDWEAAAAGAEADGIRVVTIRTGLVLAGSGGLLRPQLPLYRVGLGARLGSGRQWMSWVTLEDEVAAIVHALDDPDISGPVNVVAPEPVTNAEFTATLARVLGRPALLSVPAVVLRTALGREMADEMLLCSQRVRPTVLTTGGFAFRHRTLEAALRAVLGRPA